MLCRGATKKMCYELVHGTFHYNNYPSESNKNVLRKTLRFDDTTKTSEYLPTANTHCFACNSDKKDDEILIQCQGLTNGIMTNEGCRAPCRNRFHLSCIKGYNANGFQFQYNSYPENQAQLLCPSHGCAYCNFNGKKQSAHIEYLIDCVLCHRTFHYNYCFPAGAIEFDVKRTHEDGTTETLKMMICPAHSATTVKNSKEKQLHLNACYLCDEKKRNLEPKRKLKPKRKFRFGYSRWWCRYPKTKDANYDKIGFVAVEWGNGTQSFSIVPIRNVAPFHKKYLPLARSQKDRDEWEKAADFDLYADFPTLRKENYKKVTEMVPYENKEVPKEIFVDGLCDCTGQNRCTEMTCKYLQMEVECPPMCSEDGRVCHNRKFSTNSTEALGKIILGDAGAKGLGVFAAELLSPKQFVGVYVGELFDENEKIKRKEIQALANDSEASNYMMDIKDGTGNLTIDASRYGNILRHVNHSCQPNCKMVTKMIYRGVKLNGEGENLLYVERPCLVTIAEIKPGHELTFDYRMENKENMKCMCGADNCTGQLRGKMANKKKEKNEAPQDNSETDSSGSAPGPAPRPRQRAAAKPKPRRAALKPIQKSVDASKTTPSEESKVEKPVSVRKSRKRVQPANVEDSNSSAKRGQQVDDDGAGPAPPPRANYDDSDAEMDQEKENQK